MSAGRGPTKLILLLLVLFGLAWFLSQIGLLVKLVVIGSVLAYLLDPLVRSLETHGMERGSATGVIFVVIVSIVILVFVLLIPHLKEELISLRQNFSAGKATEAIASLETQLEERLSFLGVGDIGLLTRVQMHMSSISTEVLRTLLDVVTLITSLLIVPFVMFFLLKDGREIIKAAIAAVPNSHFEMMVSLVYKTDRQLGGYIRGQVIDSLIIGSLTVLALWILEIKYFVVLGIIMGIANLVPFVGPIVASIPPALVALMDGGDFQKAFHVIIAMGIVQMIDNAAVKPIAVAKMVSIHPIVVLLAIIVGGKFFGVLGMLLSVPVVCVIKLVAYEVVTNIRKFSFIYD